MKQQDPIQKLFSKHNLTFLYLGRLHNDIRVCIKVYLNYTYGLYDKVKNQQALLNLNRDLFSLYKSFKRREQPIG